LRSPEGIGKVTAVPGARLWVEWIGIGLSVGLQTSAVVFSKFAGLYSADKGLSALVVNPWYVATMAALALQALVWTLVLRKVPVSLAYPFMSLVFPMSLVCAFLILGEKVGSAHVLGTALICAGVALVGMEARA